MHTARCCRRRVWATSIRGLRLSICNTLINFRTLAYKYNTLGLLYPPQQRTERRSIRQTPFFHTASAPIGSSSLKSITIASLYIEVIKIRMHAFFQPKAS